LLSACAPSDHQLAELGRRGAIQANAPVKASSILIVHAPARVVWRTLADVATWPRWQPGIEAVSSNGTLGEGTLFTWKTDGTTIHSRVVLFDPPHRLAWIGQADMAHAVHVFVLAPLGPHATRIESRESMDGPLLDWFYDSAALQASEDALLQNLKKAAEAATAKNEATEVAVSHALPEQPPQAAPHQRD
jgi:Polyketide cyclase / dehydrase and lipid transport.